MSQAEQSELPAAMAVLVPLLNPNEPEARVADLPIAEGQYVEAGAELCTLETTKATGVLEAESAGYIAGLHAAAGQTVRAGEILCYLAADPAWQPPDPSPAESPGPGPVPGAESGLRITRPALALARQRGLDLDKLPRDILITQAVIENMLAAQHQPSTAAAPEGGLRAVLVYGGGGHGKAVIELLRATGMYDLAGLVDDGLVPGADVLGVPVLGGGDVLPQLHQQGIVQAVNAVGGIGDSGSRVRVFERLAADDFYCPAVVHPSTVIEPSAELAEGVQVFPLAYIGSSASIGFGAIVNTGAIVSHDCRVAEYANLSPGAILAGGVQIGARALIGMGVTVNLGVQVGEGARVGNGATVKADVPAQGVVKAGSVWPP